MAVYRPLNLPPNPNSNSDVTIMTPGGQPVMYQWDDNYGGTMAVDTPNPNAGESRIVLSDQTEWNQ